MPYPENKRLPHILNKMDSCLQGKIPFAIYRKPLENKITGVFQADDLLHQTKDFSEKGFVFAPFNLENGIVLIKPDEILSSTFDVEQASESKEIKTSDLGKEEHLDLINKGIDQIKSGKLRKVVLSRKIEVKVDTHPQEIFKQLLKRYPNAFCYLLHHPKVGTWCGATPETLVRIKHGKLKTMSLAATVPFKANEAPQWGQKEMEEQQMVSDYIEQRMESTIDELYIGKPESIRAGNLWHLKSEVSGTLPKDADLKKIITALHPTPAVCGIPYQLARDFIKNHENCKRTFYTGFLGELNLFTQDEISFFVNLRCMELHQGMASIFVGGGITAGSNPESEWIETQNKSKTMLDIL